MKQVNEIEVTKAISLVLKDLMQSNKLTQDKANDLFKIENGIEAHFGRYHSKHNITVSKLFTFCKFYGISLSKFFKLVEEKNKNLKITEKAKSLKKEEE